MKIRTQHIASLFLGTLATASLVACGGGSAGTTTTTPTVTTNAYKGAGSAWTVNSSSDGSCTLAEANSGLSVSATCSTLASGFTKIVVKSATGGNATLPAPAAGSVSYAYEVAGYMMPFIAFGESKVVPTVKAGTCTDTVDHNYIVSFAKLKDAASTFTNWSHMGHYNINASTGLTIHGYEANGTAAFSPNPKNISNYNLSSCANGVMNGNDSGATNSFYLTQNGGAIFQQDRTNQTRIDGSEGSMENDFMLPVNNDVSNLAGLDGSYIGFVITSQGTGNYTTTPVSVAASNGTFAVSALSGADLSTATANHSSFGLTTKVSASLYRGSLTHTNPGASIGCAINANVGNKKIVICSGLDPADISNKTLFSVILRGV